MTAGHGAWLHGGGPLDLLAFATLGLVGSAAHCVGMCAPFVMIVSRRFGVPDGRHSPIAAQLWYTGGRVVTYAALGAAAGIFGGVVQRAGGLVGVQRAAAALAGITLVGWACLNLTERGRSTGPSHGWFNRVTKHFAQRMPGHPLSVGLLLGLLPCGLLYSAVVASSALGGPLHSALALGAFGLGTAPALLGVSLADTWFVRSRLTLNRVSHLFVLGMGVWFLWRGLGLASASRIW